MAASLAVELVYQPVSVPAALLLLAVLMEWARAKAMLPALAGACTEEEGGAIGRPGEARPSAWAVV